MISVSEKCVGFFQVLIPNLYCVPFSNKDSVLKAPNVNFLTTSTWRGKERKEIYMKTQEKTKVFQIGEGVESGIKHHNLYCISVVLNNPYIILIKKKYFRFFISPNMWVKN
jgi:hypothetical protein